jgi:hypothetical protein
MSYAVLVIVSRFAIGLALEMVLYVLIPLLIVHGSIFGAHRGHFQPFTCANELMRSSGYLIVAIAVFALIATYQLIDPRNVPDLSL